MKQMFYRLLRLLWTSAALLIILVALLVSVARMFMPLLGDYRENIERLASEQLGRTVHIGAVGASWQGLWPSIYLDKLSILGRDGKKPWLVADKVEFSINVLSILMERRLDPGRIVVRGANLRLDFNDKTQKYSLNGEALDLGKASEQGQEQLIRWLFSRDHLGIRDSHLAYHDPRYSEQVLEIRNSSLHLEQLQGMHRLRGKFQLPDQGDRSLSFIVEMKGDVLTPEKTHNRVYVQGDLLVTQWLQRRLKKYIELASGEISLQAWADGNLSKVEKVTTRIALKQFTWAMPVKKAEQRISSYIDALSANVFWRRQSNGWSLDLEKLVLNRMGRSWPTQDSHLVYYQPEKDAEPILEGKLGFARLQDINALLLTYLPREEKSAATMRALDVRGELSDVRFRLQAEGLKWRYFLKAGLHDFGYSLFHKVPGVEGVDGKLLMDQNGGVVHLDSKFSSVDFGKLFRAPLRADVMKGDFFWVRNSEGIRIAAEDLDVTNQNINTHSRLWMDIPTSGGSPFLDMQVVFRNGDAAYASDYYPRGIMHPNVVKWLDQGLVSGHVKSGGMLFHGRLADFPFKQDQGTFMVRFDVDDMLLNYQPGWPRAQKFAADVLFYGPSLEVNIKSGEVLGLQALPSRVVIRDLLRDATLDMDLHLKGSTQSVLQYLENSPAGSDMKAFLRETGSSGNSLVDLNMQIPLMHAHKYSMKGSVSFAESSLDLKEWDRKFTDINGKLAFYTKSGRLFFSASKMQARYFGVPSVLDVNSRMTGSQMLTRINMSAHMSAHALFRNDVPVLPDYLKGKSDWLVSLALSSPGRKAAQDARLSIESKLKGIQIPLPDGMGKHAGDSRLFRADIELGGPQIGPVFLKYQNGFSAALAIRKQAGNIQISHGEIQLGNQQAQLGKQEKGLHVGGKWAVISLNQWHALVDKKGNGSNQQIRFLDQLTSMDVQIGRINLTKHVFHDIQLKLQQQPEFWDAKVKSRELAGMIVYPKTLSSGKPVVMDLDYFKYVSGEADPNEEIPDPRKIPSLNIKVKSLTLDKVQLGKASLLAYSRPEGIMIESFTIDAPHLNVKAKGAWEFKDSWHISRFDVTAHTDQVGKALAMWNYKANIEGGKGEAILSKASWSGPPHWFEMKRLSGQLKVTINKGVLRDVDPGGGRIFGLMSLQALPRRLTLDFTDLFKKGLSFDRIEGTFSISDGEAYTNNLFLDGPAAHVDIHGRIGLADRDYDQTVVVIPRISSSMSLLGGLAAGPQVGIGLFIADKLLGKKIGKIAAVHYSLKGSWDNPKFEVIHQQNGGGKKNK